MNLQRRAASALGKGRDAKGPERFRRHSMGFVPAQPILRAWESSPLPIAQPLGGAQALQRKWSAVLPAWINARPVPSRDEPGEDRAAYCALIPAARITGHHFSISAAWKAARAA